MSPYEIAEYIRELAEDEQAAMRPVSAARLRAQADRIELTWES